MDYHSPYFFGYVLGIIHLLGIIAALHAVFTVRTAQGAIAWAMSLFFIPYFTLIPYLIFGARSFYAYIQARRQANQEMHVAMATSIGARGWKRRSRRGSRKAMPPCVPCRNSAVCRVWPITK